MTISEFSCASVPTISCTVSSIFSAGYSFASTGSEVAASSSVPALIAGSAVISETTPSSTTAGSSVVTGSTDTSTTGGCSVIVVVSSIYSLASTTSA